MSTEPTWNQPGGLGIKERRAWQTWQLAIAAFVAMLIGMGIGHTGGGGTSQASNASSSGSSGASGGRFVPPPDGSSSAPATTASPSAGPSSASSATTTTTVASSTPTTAPVSVSGAADGVLLPKTTGSGSQTLASFSASGPWKLGYAYQCAGAGAFQVNVVAEASTTPASPAVNSTQPSGQGVSDQTTTGRQHLEVRAGPACRWAIKASGPA